LGTVLAEAGVRIGNGVIVDPVDHYFTDQQMLAVTKYASHPVTRAQALSFYPGARPVEPAPREGVRAVALFASSPQSYVVQDRARYREEAAGAAKRSYPIAVAAEGRMTSAAPPFRVIVVGDADFASNSFFPYLANADIVLAGVSWLLREDRLASLKPPVEVLPTVSLTNTQVRWIFILTVILVLFPLLGLGAEAGGWAAATLTFLAVFQHADMRTPRWLGYVVQRPESHAIHHQRGVHAYNYADLPLWDMLFGTFRNAPAGAKPPQGFHDGASARIVEMLAFRDVSRPTLER